MKDITNEKLEILESVRLDVIYHPKPKDVSVTYAKVSIAVVKNPYTDKLDIAVRPLVKNAYGEFVPLYSYEEDIQYQYCMQVCTKCMYANEPIPEDVDTFVQALMKKKEFARKQADEYVAKELNVNIENVSTAFARSEWREDVVSNEIVKKLLDEYN